MDLFGPIEPMSVTGKKYILVVVDDYSRFTWMIFMAKKSYTKKRLPELMKLVQNELSLSIVKIR